MSCERGFQIQETLRKLKIYMNPILIEIIVTYVDLQLDFTIKLRGAEYVKYLFYINVLKITVHCEGFQMKD